MLKSKGLGQERKSRRRARVLLKIGLEKIAVSCPPSPQEKLCTSPQLFFFYWLVLELIRISQNQDPCEVVHGEKGAEVLYRAFLFNHKDLLARIQIRLVTGILFSRRLRYTTILWDDSLKATPPCTFEQTCATFCRSNYKYRSRA